MAKRDRAKYMREWRKRNPGKEDSYRDAEKRSEYMREYHRQHPEKRLESAKKRRAKNMHETVTYFMQCGGYVKIGQTTNITKRLTEMRVHCPYPVELLGVCGLEEKVVQDKFQHLHHQGEWFILDDKLSHFISEVST